MAKPRKKYKHDPLRKYDSPFIRKADSESNLRIAAAMKENIEDAKDGSSQAPLIGAIVELLEGVLIALQGWTVDQDVIDSIAQGMGACTKMDEAGGVWSSESAAAICSAVDDAIAVMNQLPMRGASRGFIGARMLTKFVKPLQAIKVVDMEAA